VALGMVCGSASPSHPGMPPLTAPAGFATLSMAKRLTGSGQIFQIAMYHEAISATR
jgi:hypothetical protein